ncbi:MAG: hypothetical protein Q8J78_06495 [Moraxellaceae bacterium]|nr:hypothetical protein [Moraxellaceae bacterium]
MSSGGKGGSASQSKNYYGTLAGAICWGPLDWINAVIHNGNYLFHGDLTLVDDVTDLTGSLLDPKLIGPGGYLKIYRGTETQPADPALWGHPPYPGTAMVVGKHLFFGQDSGTAPNLQVIGGRLPRVPTAIVAAVDNIVDDGQINPIAAWAEILLDERGGAFDVAQLDAASWSAAAHWCAQDQEHRDFTFCSPLIAEQSALRAIAQQLLGPFNGFCRWTNAGKLACNVYEWGADPGGLQVLDWRHWTKRPTFPLGDWDEVPTEVMVTFTNRDYEFQNDSHIVPNGRAAQIRQVDDQARLDRKHVTRKAQIHRHGVEYNRRIGTAPSELTVRVRQPFVDGLSVGDKIKIDTDPEPGGAGLAQLVRIEAITQDRSDEATLKVVTDNLVPATAYTPTWTPPVVIDEESPPLVNFIGVPLPPNAWGWPPAVGLLASRPAAKIAGFEAYFGPTSEGSFADLGQQPGFAVRATLAGDAADSALVLGFTETDGLDAPDAGLAADTPGGNATEAGNNVLLGLLATLDGNGRIAIGGNGDPVMEFVSIVDRAVVAGATFNYTVLRGRLGTTARAWAAATTVVWIAPRVNIVPWRHSLLSAMLGGVAYFRLVSFTAHAVDDTLPVPELSVNMLPATAPMFGGNIDGDGSPDDGPAPNPVSGVTVTAGLSMLVLEWSNPTNMPLKAIFIYESVDVTPPALPQFVLGPEMKFFFRTGLPSSALKYYWIEVQGVNGRRTRAGPFSNTTRAGIDLADIVAGMTMVEIVNSLPATGNFDGRTVFLTTTKKLYRYDVGAGSFIASVPTVDLTGQITQTQITDNSVSTSKLAALAITAEKIATNAITAEKLAANAVTAGVISAGAITAAAVGTNEIIAHAANIAAAVITSAKIASLAANKIEAGTITAALEILSPLIRSSGATGVMTGAGFWMGIDGGVYKFRVGDPAGAHILWDGSTWTAVGWPGGGPQTIPPVIVQGSSPVIQVQDPGGTPAGWQAQFTVNYGAVNSVPASQLPWNVNMGSASNRMVIWGHAPAYSDSGITDTSWTELS